MISQNGESSRDRLLSVINRKALAPGGHSPQSPPLNINYITTSHFLTTPPEVGGVGCVGCVCLCISVMQKKKSTLNRTFSTESYRNWRKSINILKNNGLFFKE